MRKLERFLQALEDHGDYYISTGDTQQDIRMIEERIAFQGYWAGNELRFFFDKDFNLLRTEERRFG